MAAKTRAIKKTVKKRIAPKPLMARDARKVALEHQRNPNVSIYIVVLDKLILDKAKKGQLYIVDPIAAIKTLKTTLSDYEFAAISKHYRTRGFVISKQRISW